MSDYPFLNAFPFDQPSVPVSLYAYAPVFKVDDCRGEWVVKRTGLAHSSGEAIGAWVSALRRKGVAIVAPVDNFAPNPRILADGCLWVVYPYVAGQPYTGRLDQISGAGALLGQIHAADVAETAALKTFESPIFQTSEWLSRHEHDASAALRSAGYSGDIFRAWFNIYVAEIFPVEGLPLAGCSFDFKASNLVFAAEPVLIDPDHAARMPRIYDLAIATLLFHNDVPTAPARLWSRHEWETFAGGYRQHISLTTHELGAWVNILRLAWLDQAIWLLGNFPEGWANAREAKYLSDLATVNLDRFYLR